MGVSTFHDLFEHAGHNVEVVTYGRDGKTVNVAIECTDCNEVLVDFDRFPEEEVWPMYSGDNRDLQTDEIHRLAVDTFDNANVTAEDYLGDVDTLVTDLVINTLEGVDLPDWWDEHDTSLMTEKIRDMVLGEEEDG